MATERALVKRGNVVTDTVRTMFDPNASPSDRTGAAVKTVTVSGAVLGGGFVGADMLATHAGGFLAAVGSAGEVGFIATGAAAVIGAVGIVGGRIAENDRYSDTGKEAVRQMNHSFYRRVGVGVLAAGGVAAAVAGAVTGAADLGLIQHVPHLAAGLTQAAEAGVGVGAVSIGVAHTFARRSRNVGPAALGE